MVSCLNFVALIFATFAYASWLGKSLLVQGFSFGAGIALGVLYFVLLPLWICALNGVLPTPVDFAGTRIPDLHWVGDAGTIAVMLGPVFALPLFELFRRALPTRPAQIKRTDHTAEAYELHFLIYTLIAIFAFVASGLADGGHWYRTKEEFLSNYGLVGALLLYSIFATRVLFLAAAVSAWLRGRISTGWLLTLIALICGLDLYTTGNRIFSLQSAMVLAAGLLIKRKFRLLAFGAAAAVPFGAFMGAFRWVRAYLYEFTGTGLSGMVAGLNKGVAFAMDQVATNGFSVVNFLSGASESVNINVYSFIVKEFSRRNDYFLGLSLAKIVVFPVPRSVWASKPDSITVMVGKILAPGADVSLVTTIFGEIYANFGVFSIVLSPLFIGLAGWVTSRVFRPYAMGHVMAFVVAFTLVRMPYSDVMIYTLLMAAYLAGIKSIKRLLAVGPRATRARSV